jgi:hypothetical protein
MNVFRSLTALVALLIAFSIPAAAPVSAVIGERSLEDLGSLGGTTRALAVNGATLLIGEGTNLVTAELKSGTTPRIRARLALPGHPLAIRAFGSLAAVKTSRYSDGYDQSMQLIDVRDLSQPRLLASYATPNMPAVTDNMVYLAMGDGVHVIDVTDRSQPVERGFYAALLYQSTVVLNLPLLLIAETQRLHILSATDQANPTLLSIYESPAPITDVLLRGSLVYLVGDTTLQVLDITDTQTPSLLATLTLPLVAHALIADTTTIYVAAGPTSLPWEMPTALVTVDLADPLAPTLRGSYQVPSGIAAIEPAGDVTLVAADEAGLLVLDTNRVGPPILRGQYQPRGAALDVQAQYGLAYLAVDGRGLEIVATGGAGPSPIGALRLLGSVQVTQVSHGIAAAADGTSLWVLDLRTPAQPITIFEADLDMPSTADPIPWIETADGYTYVAIHHTVRNGEQMAEKADILTIDTSRRPPIVLGRATIALPAGATAVRFARVGNTIFITSGTDEVGVIDVSDLLRPAHSGMLFVEDAVDVKGVGDRAYILSRSGAVRIMQVQTAAQMTLLGVYDGTGSVTDMRIVGSTVYLSGEAGFTIVDMRDPAAPMIIGALGPDTPVGAIHVTTGRANLLRYGSVFGAGWSALITVIDIEDPTTPKQLATMIYGGGVDVGFRGTSPVVAVRTRYPTRPLHGWIVVFGQPDLGSYVYARAEVPSPPVGLAVERGQIYAATGASGLRLYTFELSNYLPWAQR